MAMGIDLCERRPELCCGCGACAAVCPQKAISLVDRTNGFLYPRIDENKCIECGLCLRVCSFKSFVATGKKPDCYAVKHKDKEEVLTSRSGGFFMALCKYVIDQEGAVFGCQVVQQKIIHKVESTYEGCKRFKGSKYVQSDLKNTFVECMELLENGRMVLFSGTGCQIHGLLSFLKARNTPTDRLLTVDIVCHGVPSPGVWQTYVKLLEKRQNSILSTVDFRDKEIKGWAAHIEKYTFADNSVRHATNWATGFYRHIIFRESCYACKYTTTERNSDFTIADYWGIDKNAPEYDDNKGCSLVLVHSTNGRRIFGKINQEIRYSPTKLETSLQPQLKRPIWKGWDANLFWHIYRNNPDRAVRMWFFPSLMTRFIWKIEKCAKLFIKRIIKRL